MALTLPNFLYCTCQIGAEAALKADVCARAPALRPAFGRPGLVTFKDTRGGVPAEAPSPSPLARAWGAALGPVADAGAVAAAIARTFPEGEALRLHVFERDRWRPGDEPEGFVYGPAAAAARAEIVASWPEGHPLLAGEEAAAGDLVVDVIVAPDEAMTVGFHRHGGGRVRWPGGRIPVEMPADSPSRAYRKLEEAVIWSGAPLRAGDVALEIGSSPGGASYALLRRGLTVHGIDPGLMDPVVLGFEGPGGARFVHHHAPMAQVERRDLPTELHWVLCDVNLAPQVALHGVRRIVSTLRAGLRGVLFTLKLNDWSMAREVPALLGRVEAMGLRAVRATQLPSNRREICVAAEAGVPGGAS